MPGRSGARHCWSTEGMVLGMLDDENFDELTIGVRKGIY